MLTRLVSAALVAALVAGVTVSLLEETTTTPLIMAADYYGCRAI